MSAFRGLTVALLMAASIGCSARERALSIRVTGTPGTSVVGQYVLVSEGVRIHRPIDGKVPFDLELIGTEVSCYLQKLGQPGTVHLQVLVAGRPIAFASTHFRFGNVTAKTP